MHRTLSQWLLLFTGLLIACDGGETRGQSQKERVMSDIQIELVAGQEETIINGSLPVTVVVRNTSDRLLDFYTVDSDSPFVFELSHKEKDLRYRASSREYEERTQPEPAPPLLPETDLLAPGKKRRFEEDVAAYLVDALETGPWELIVSFPFEGEWHRSEPIEFRIVAPNAGQFAQIADETRVRFASVLTHRQADGEASTYQWESVADVGVWYPRHTAKPPTTIGGLAVCAYVGSPDSWRWIGWLENGDLRGVNGEGRGIYRKTDLAALDLESPRLHEAGWQDSDGRALFLVTGNREGRFAPCIVSFWGESDSAVHMPEWGDDPAPESVAATFVPSSELPIQLIWSEKGGRLRTRSLAAGKPLGAARTLLENTRPVFKLAVAPVVHEGPATVHALLGPAGEEKDLLYIMVPLSGERPPVEYSLAPVENEAVIAWALNPASVQGRHVLALTGKRLLTACAGAPESWHVVEEGDEGELTHPRLTQLTKLWATWVDRKSGVQRRAFE